jgi:hypothetical protein
MLRCHTSAALLLLPPLVVRRPLVLQHHVVLLFGRRFSHGVGVFDEAALDCLVYFSTEIPKSIWKAYSMFLFYLAEHWIKPQKSLFLANSSRNFLVWCTYGFWLLMRSDLFWTRRQGILTSVPMSVFSSMVFFHFSVSYMVLLSLEEQTMAQPI